MRLFSVLPILALAACASGGSSLSASEKSISLGDGSGGALRLRGSDGAKVSQLAFPMDKVWRVLPAVYDSLGMTITDMDPGTHILGNGGFKAHKTLGKVNLSKYIDCGNTQGFPSAESYDIQLSVKTQVEESKEGGTSVGTLIEAAGRPMAFAGEYVRCSTKGELEQRISDIARKMLSP